MEDAILVEVIPLVGGKDNISFQNIGHGQLYIRLKDQTLADIPALQKLEGVEQVTLKNGQLNIFLSEKKKEASSMANNKQIAKDVLQAVGGKENVASVTHCMTRLRFNLKDNSLADKDVIKKIDGVLSVVMAGGQFQVVIGNNVSKVYEEICSIGGFAKQEAIDENLDQPKEEEKLTVKSFCKKFFGGMLDGVSGCVVPLIPLLMVAGLLKMVPVLFSGTLGIMSPESDLYTLLTFAGDAGFYFLPVAIGYTGAKKFGATPILGILLGAMLIHPTFMAMATAQEAVKFTVFGIPCTLENYAQTIIPMILATWCMGYVERFFKRYIPDFLSTVFTPLLTIIIMIPLTFCFFGPVGYWLGNVVYAILNGLYSVAGPLGFALVCALWMLLLTCGMHQVLLTMALVNLFAGNPDNFVMAASALSAFATYGVMIGGFIRAKKKETRTQLVAYFLSNFLGGVGEPVLFGFILKYKKPLIGQIVGGFVGGLVGGIAGITVYQAMPVLNFLNFLGYVGGSTSNVVWAAISAAVCVVVAAVVTAIIGFDEDAA